MDVFKEELKKLQDDDNNLSILLVGSAQTLDLMDRKDIDLFVITKSGKYQIREIKKISNIEFDINYFPLSIVDKLIDDKEQFFIEAMSNSTIIYDKQGFAFEYVNLCVKEYNKGPEKLSHDEILNIYFSLVDDIKRIKYRQDIDKGEISYLYSVYLKRALDVYFRLNNKWIPKDKKMFKVLKKEDIYLYEMIKKLYKTYDCCILEDIIRYIFKGNLEKTYIKMIYKRGDDLNG
ncbi:hypothetical protein SAMN05661008_00587 [Alkalithermobacter thermoalcaliphilus JW-YL-7 = DSM 7308]|uniref:DNA polymerase beta domain protein region n=1 Tax=Alkalithermobacter thermoalcaliphilus JW-YL-7 = DSM 7308 TaxID=1121328 RepID=A0A150FR94_CLOPD|nr:DNA polymerase beta domain protein region [[Clostridium] paradoxum JW-YL-7 = DSM 7308]SHK62828.1 hypothetical protein SAMN05661008_00587 [[Clostridium] paradoxum JW-YL-7 = DSM 7308]